MKKNHILIFFLFLIPYSLFLHPVSASYVLPYPSFMPGNKVYIVARMFDDVKKYWYFGNIAKVKYELGLSDKYLVEAKTLLEYNQFLLAVDALVRSNNHVEKVTLYVIAAQKEGKDMVSVKEQIGEAMAEHERVLLESKNRIPEFFDWKPEKGEEKNLMLHRDIDEALALRQKIQNEVSQNP